MKMADGTTILRRNRPGTKAKVRIKLLLTFANVANMRPFKNMPPPAYLCRISFSKHYIVWRIRTIFCTGFLSLARWGVRGNGQHAGCATIHSTADQERPVEHRLNFKDAWCSRWGSLEVRASKVGAKCKWLRKIKRYFRIFAGSFAWN